MSALATVRFAAMLALSGALTSCTNSSSIEVTIVGATATTNNAGRAAINLSLSKEDARNFLVFTTLLRHCICISDHDCELTHKSDAAKKIAT
jgi:hypothetical protein